MSKKGIFIPDMDKEKYDAMVKTIAAAFRYKMANDNKFDTFLDVLYFVQYELIMEHMKSAEEIEIPDEENEPEEAPMTCRDWIYHHKPERISPFAVGGVFSCPGDYPGLNALGIYDDVSVRCPRRLNRGISCEDCWDRPIPKKEEE